MSSPAVVALFNSKTDAIALLTKLLDSAGFTVVSAPIPEGRQGGRNFDALMTQHDPSVVVYDIAPPYAVSWELFQGLRARPTMCDCRFVLTAINAEEVERLAVRDERIYEVVEKGSDLSEFVHAVKEAARARTLIRADATPPSNVTPIPDATSRSNVTPMPERRFHSERRDAWTSNDIYRKLREKREEVESERRRGGRRATDHGPDRSHAA